jgi:hypothetical protein
MRKTILILSLVMFASLCFGCSSAAVKQEVTQKAPQVAPADAQKETPKEAPKETPRPLPRAAYVEKQTGIAFPVSLGSMTFGESNTYDTPELGISVYYGVRGAVRVDADIYVYDMGIKNIGEGIDSNLANNHFKQCQGDISLIEKRGDYRDVTKIAEKTVALKIGGKELPMLCAVFEYSIVPDPGQSGEPRPVVSHIFLTTYRNNFLKIRFTYSAAGRDKGDEILKGFLDALGDAMNK